MSIEEKFKEAVQFVRDSPVKEVTPEEKLLYYGLYKQATQGDNTQPKPYAFQVKAIQVFNWYL
jgi:acyl-CoA-binding protein